MSALTIHGTDWAVSGRHGNDAWIVVDGYDVCIDVEDITYAHEQIENPENPTGLAQLGPIVVDESQLNAIENGPTLDDCAQCEGPGLVTVEGRVLCPGCVRSYGMREEAS